MAQVVSAGPLLAEMRPVEYPAENFQALCLALRGGVAFDRVVAPVMAVQVQRAVLAEAEVVHPEHAVVQQGIGLALDHLGHAQVDGQGGLQRYQRHHVAGRHCHADGVIATYTQPFQRFCGQAQVFARNWRKQAVLQLVKGHLHYPAAMYRQRGRWVGRCRPWRAAAQDRVGVLGPFARTQPTAMNTEQVGQLVQPGQGHTAVEPVVDVLRCDAAQGGEVGRGQATFMEKGFEAVARIVHAASVAAVGQQGYEPGVDGICEKSAGL